MLYKYCFAEYCLLESNQDRLLAEQLAEGFKGCCDTSFQCQENGLLSHTCSLFVKTIFRRVELPRIAVTFRKGCIDNGIEPETKKACQQQPRHW